MNHMTENNLFRTQFGFRTGRSTTLQLLNVMDLWTEAIDQEESVDTIYLDFMKAFDVPHSRLPHKMNVYGMSDATLKTLKWVDNFLVGRTHWVSVNGHDAPGFTSTSGIPQGSVLGPTLFLIYLNYLPSVINSFIFLFADDDKIFRVINHKEDPTLLQGDLASLQDWCSKWRLSLHPDKYKHMTTAKSANTDYNLVAHGTTTGIKSVEC